MSDRALRPNNPHADYPGTLIAQMWELRAEVDHLKRIIKVKALGAAQSLLRTTGY